MIYADTGIIIRLIEGDDPVRSPIERSLQDLEDQDRAIVTSRLARLECRRKPIREENEDLLRLYDAFFDSREVTIVEIDAPVVEKATLLRAGLRLRTPDAIHAATAILCGASAFWTTDKSFTTCPELTVNVFAAV